jgi:hypothetical protein
MTGKKIIALTLVIFSVISINAQQQPMHAKKVFTAPNGNFYMNKDLPVYFFIATSDDPEAPKYLLRSTETPAYANPMYLDTEGYNTFRSPSAVDTVTKDIVYPLRDVIFEVYSDSKAPVTSLKYGESKIHKENNIVYLDGNAEVDLSSKDATSGVEDIYVSIDSAAYKKYSGKIPLNQEKGYNLKYYAVDNVGNVEDIHEVNIVIDKTTPKTSIAFEGDKHEDIFSARSKITLSADDKGIGVKNITYSIDDGKPVIYKYPIQTKYLSAGEHKLTYFATDKVNNEETKIEYSFYVDKTAPTIVEELVGTSFMANGREFTSGRTQLKLVTFDNKAGVKEVYYSINGEDYKLYEKPFYLSMSSGNLQVKTYAIDNVNNKSVGEESSARSKIPYIDLSGPSLKYQFKGPVFTTSDTIFINKETEIVLRGTDQEAGMNKISYRVDGKTTEEYNKAFNISKEGYHKIFFEGSDNVENTNNKEFNVFVDNTGPMTFASFSVQSKGKERIGTSNLDVYPSHLVVFLSATDEKVGVDRIYYKLNDSPERLYAGLITNLKPDKYTLEVRAVDKLGNSTTEKFKFAVK